MSQQSVRPLGLSPCPNDTFIFHALLHGRVPFPFGTIEPHLADVEELNRSCLAARLPFSKISIGVIRSIMDNYALLSAGAALGFGCGPLVVARHGLSPEECLNGTVAIPGEETTANLLLTLTDRFHGKRSAMLFSDVIPAVAGGRCDLGVIIHEGRFTYEQHGLVKILDLGEWWETTWHLPLPLGAIVVRRDVPSDVAHGMQQAIAASLSYAWEHPTESRGYIREHAQELEESVIDAHIRTFVTQYSRDLGDEGRRAIETLVTAAADMAGRRLPEDGLFLA